MNVSPALDGGPHRAGRPPIIGRFAKVARQSPLAWLREQGFALVLLAILILLTLVPLASLVVGSFRPLGLPLGSGWTVAHYVDVWTSPHMARVVANTLAFAVGSSIITLVVAGALAWLIERTNLPARSWFAAGIILPMATPPLLLAIGWVLLTSPQIGLFSGFVKWLFGPAAAFPSFYGLGGMIFVQSLAMVPTSFMVLAPVMRNMDPSLEEAAAMSGAGTLQTLRRIFIPLLTPSVLSLATYVLIVGMLSFDIPAIIGMPGNVYVMSSEVFILMNPAASIPDYGKSAAMNSSLFVVLGGALAFYYYMTHQGERFSTIKGKAFRPRRLDLGVWRMPAALGVWAYFCCAVLLPFLMILWVSLTPYFSGFDPSLIPQLSFRRIFTTLKEPRVADSVVNSVIVSVTAASVLTVLSLLLGWTIIRSREGWTRVLDVLAVIPIAVPHLMMGVALVFIFFSFRAIPIYGTVWVIALGHVIVYLPVGVRMMQAAILQLHGELEEAAATSGATTFQSITRIVVPLIRPSIVTLFIWVLVHSFREFSVSVMLRSGNNDVLSTVLYSFWDNGQPDAAAAIAVTMMLALGLIALLANRIGAYGRADEQTG